MVIHSFLLLNWTVASIWVYLLLGFFAVVLLVLFFRCLLGLASVDWWFWASLLAYLCSLAWDSLCCSFNFGGYLKPLRVSLWIWIDLPFWACSHFVLSSGDLASSSCHLSSNFSLVFAYWFWYLDLIVLVSLWFGLDSFSAVHHGI